MKSAYYVAAVTNAYRHALDSALAGEPLPELWRRETDMLSHRPYSTGFYFGQPGQYTADARYESAADVVAVVESCDGEGNARLTQRNKFFAGDTLELLLPGAEPLRFEAERLFNDEGESLEEIRHPMMLFGMRLPCAAPKGCVVRKRR